jgi:hypothetical protein
MLNHIYRKKQERQKDKEGNLKNSDLFHIKQQEQTSMDVTRFFPRNPDVFSCDNQHHNFPIFAVLHY